MPNSPVDLFVSCVARGDVEELKQLLSSSPGGSSSFQQELKSAELSFDQQVKNSHDSQGDSAVQVATKKRNSKMLDFLINQIGCDPNGDLEKQNKAPIHVAASSGDVACLKVFLSCSSTDVNAVAPSDGWSALHSVIFAKQLEAAKLLLSHSTSTSTSTSSTSSSLNVNIQNRKEGQTALHIASYQGLLTIVRQLLLSGADVGLVDKKGDTVTHHALQYRMTKLVGADKFTVPEPQWEIAVLLALAGCSGEQQNKEGDSAFAFIDKKFSAFGNALKTLAKMKIDLVRALKEEEEEREVTRNIGYKFLVTADPQEIQQVLHCETLGAAKEISESMRTLEKQRAEYRQEQRKKSEEMEKVKEEEERQRKLKEQQQQSSSEGESKSNNKLTGEHHQGVSIDLQSLGFGEDPSNGECPFLKIRADQQKRQKERQDKEDQEEMRKKVRDEIETELNSKHKQQLFVVSLASFALGFLTCKLLLGKKK